MVMSLLFSAVVDRRDRGGRQGRRGRRRLGGRGAGALPPARASLRARPSLASQRRRRPAPRGRHASGTFTPYDLRHRQYF